MKTNYTYDDLIKIARIEVAEYEKVDYMEVRPEAIIKRARIAGMIALLAAVSNEDIDDWSEDYEKIRNDVWRD